MWEWDLETQMIWFDDGIRSLYELTFKENFIHQDKWYSFLHPEDLPTVASDVMNLIAHEKEYKSIFRISTPDGTEKYISTYALKLVDPVSAQVTLIGLNFDVSENQKMQKILIEQSKLAHLGQITSGIAHEVNNPLSIIFGRAGLMKVKAESGAYDSKKIIEDADSIQKNADRIAKTISSLTAFSRNSIHDPFENISMLQILDEVFEIMKENLSRHSIDFRLPIYKKLNHQSLVEVRESEILQVLINLLNNSIDAIQKLENQWIEMDVVESANCYDVLITDSGNGINSEVAKRMMEPFFTTKEKGQGTGLGLSLAQQIVKAHNGLLYFNSENINTQFVVRLKKNIKA